MTTFEIVLVVLMVAALAVNVGVSFQNRAIGREVRAEGRETRSHLASSAARVEEMSRAELQAMRESMQGRPGTAVETIKQAEAIPKAHRHQWAFSSVEQTNGETVRFHVCRVSGCRDVYREGPDDEAPAESVP